MYFRKHITVYKAHIAIFVVVKVVVVKIYISWNMTLFHYAFISQKP